MMLPVVSFTLKPIPLLNHNQRRVIKKPSPIQCFCEAYMNLNHTMQNDQIMKSAISFVLVFCTFPDNPEINT